MSNLMRYNSIAGISFSEITLGTAQLGMKYGIANVLSDPDIKNSMEILHLAIKSGINCFDTAPAYQNSEKIIGEFINNHSNFTQPPTIITKLPSIAVSNKWNKDSIKTIIRSAILNSLEYLNLEKIPIYLLHDAKNLTSHNGFIMECLQKEKAKGHIELLGVSVYTIQEINDSLNSDEINVIQLPINIFDQRLLSTDILKELKHRNIGIFARSIFLQGLFFLDPYKLPKYVQKAHPYLLKLREISSRENMSIEQLAFNFVRNLQDISSIIMGVDTKQQLIQNIQLLSSPLPSSDLMKELFEEFQEIPTEIIDPRLWNK